MSIAAPMLVISLIIYAGLFGLFIYLVILIIRALKKYIRSKDVRAEKSVLKQNLGEVLKDLRTKNKMTQEFVAETIGVSRQAVSKWESGECDPSTSNLIALAKLYGTTVEEILPVDHKGIIPVARIFGYDFCSNLWIFGILLVKIIHLL